MTVGLLITLFFAAALIALALYFGLRGRRVAAPAVDVGAELERLRAALLEAQSAQRRELSGAVAQSQHGITTALVQQLGQLTDSSAQRLDALRATVDARLKDLQAENAGKLEEMRKTVDEKLQHTLEQRLGQSFKQVSDWLEQLNKGLGEMRTLAQGVGDLKRVLGNVKTRGIYAEGYLDTLLDQVLTPEQYARNVVTRAGSNERVEFAIRMPGGVDGQPCWLPIDAKFPREDYERLMDAQDRADPVAAEAAGLALERRIRLEAQSIREKYIDPPTTTDFAILFLPTEGLYAEVLRRPGLFEALQREHRVTVCGPTTLSALLNSLQMGFRTLAIEKRSSEVWQVLGAVKAEFGKFGAVLSQTKRQLQTAANSIEDAETRTRQIERKLRDVEVLPGQEEGRLPE